MKGNIIAFNGGNKLGNQVGYVVKGKQLFRAYQPNVENPRTPAQLLQRAKFTALTAVGLASRMAVRVGLKGYAQSRKSTELNAFFHLNWPNVSGNTPQTVAIDVQGLKFSKGTRYIGAWSDTIDASSTPNIIELTPTDVTSPDPAEAGDIIYGVLYNEELGECRISDTHRRTDNHVRIAYPNKWIGAEVQAYVFAVSPDGSSSSDTLYVGHATIS